MQVHRTLDPFEGFTTTQEPPLVQTGQDIPEQIKKLAELRDQGVISVEEFEAKKTDLLDRM